MRILNSIHPHHSNPLNARSCLSYRGLQNIRQNTRTLKNFFQNFLFPWNKVQPFPLNLKDESGSYDFFSRSYNILYQPLHLFAKRKTLRSNPRMFLEKLRHFKVTFEFLLPSYDALKVILKFTFTKRNVLSFKLPSPLAESRVRFRITSESRRSYKRLLSSRNRE